MKKNIFITILIIHLAESKLNAQGSIAKFSDSSVTMAMGSQYKASHWKELWWGKHYRNEWTAPVTFPVIDLNETAGGLVPTELGGGHESKSLRLLGANGREYVLRTMDKDLTVLVPDEFKESFINDIINDQISTAHPYGAIVVAKLAEAANIYHTNPVIVFVPRSERLSEFDSVIANKLCLFEERPSGAGWQHTDLTGGADKIVNTQTLLEKLKQNNDNSVDQKAFLKVRLFDIWINDWDRHDDQWVWLAHSDKGKTIYTSFARDRDQSFSKTDGINLYFASRPWALQSLQDMKPRIGNVIGTTMSARFLDNQFLNELSKDDWKETIQSLQDDLTDEKIKIAVHALPDTIFNISGNELIDILIARRNDMMRYGLKYYDILNKQVDIIGSDKTEKFIINRMSDSTTEIIVEKRDQRDILYHKIFNEKETKDIYIYGLDGNDAFYSEGVYNNKIRVTIIGGEGHDQFTADSLTAGGSRVSLYDDKTNRIATSDVYRKHFTNDTLKTLYNRLHSNYNWYAPLFIPGYNADDGVFIGGGFIFKKQHWGKEPYAWQQAFGASVAFKTGATSFFYSGRFKQIIGQWDLGIRTAYKGPQYVFNFYGYGNDTKLTTDDRSYNRVRVKQFIFTPSAEKTFGHQEISIGPMFEYLKVDDNAGKFITGYPEGIDSLAFDGNSFLGGYANYAVGKKDDEKFPTSGYHFNAGITYKKNATQNGKDFAKFSGDFIFYLPLIKSKLTLAHRSGAATNVGDYEFYHANTLGGNTNLRGYYRSRFTGKTAFYQNTELRCAIANLHGYVLRGSLGVFGFFDDGRVWIDEDNSNTFHTGYGGGIFFIPFNAAAINLSYGTSKEKNTVLIGLNFFF